MAKRPCEKCSTHGTIDCIYCGGSGFVNTRDGESIRCKACGRGGNGAGIMCCTSCNGTGYV